MVGILLLLASLACLALGFKGLKNLRELQTVPAATEQAADFDRDFEHGFSDLLAQLWKVAVPILFLVLLLGGIFNLFWCSLGFVVPLVLLALCSRNASASVGALYSAAAENKSELAIRSILKADVSSRLFCLALLGLVMSAAYLGSSIESFCFSMGWIAFGASISCLALEFWSVSFGASKKHSAALAQSWLTRPATVFAALSCLVSAFALVGQQLRLNLDHEQAWYVAASLSAAFLSMLCALISLRAIEEMEQLELGLAQRNAFLFCETILALSLLVYATFFAGVSLWHWLCVFFVFVALGLIVSFTLQSNSHANQFERLMFSIRGKTNLKLLTPLIFALFLILLCRILSARIEAVYSFCLASFMLGNLWIIASLFHNCAERISYVRDKAESAGLQQAALSVFELVENSTARNAELASLYQRIFFSLSALSLFLVWIWNGLESNLTIDPFGSLGLQLGCGSLLGIIWTSFAPNQEASQERSSLINWTLALGSFLFFALLLIHLASDWVKLGFFLSVLALELRLILAGDSRANGSIIRYLLIAALL